MIKDLVVNLAAGAGRDAAAEFAISIAAAFQAHIAGIAFAFDPVITPVILPTVMDGLSAAWIDTQRGDNLAAATAAIDRFEAAAKRQGLSAEHRLLEASVGGAANLFGAIARRFDLAVVGQTDPSRPGRNAPDDLMIEAALFGSGRPVVVVPYIQNGGLKLDRVLACWDASRSAARAIADAMSFLRRSKAVEIVTVSGGRAKTEEFPGTDIGEHLARHDLAVEVKRLVAEDVDVANTILSYAADCAADFIVMGGYGHSRLREFVLGGATRGMLESMTVPVLMSH
jgi:nucleotide-binding universal stress UspA family protein